MKTLWCDEGTLIDMKTRASDLAELVAKAGYTPVWHKYVQGLYPRCRVKVMDNGYEIREDEKQNIDAYEWINAKIEEKKKLDFLETLQ